MLLPLCKLVRNSIFFLLIFFSPYSWSAYAEPIINSNQSADSIAKAYGFILSQELQINRIKLLYPHLSTEVTLAKSAFDLAYPNAEEALSFQLEMSLDYREISRLEHEVKKAFKNGPERLTDTEEGAKSFIAEVRLRSVNKFDEEIRRYILAAIYSRKPEREFVAGHVVNFSSKNHIKAPGVEFTLTVPFSWRPSDPDNYYIIKTWTNKGGAGSENIMVYARENKSFTGLSEDTIMSLPESFIEAKVPEGAKYISGSIIKVGSWPTVSMLYEFFTDFAGVKVFAVVRQFIVISDGVVVGVACNSLGVEGGEDAVRKRHSKNELLCLSVVNSLSLPQSQDGEI